MNGEDAALTLSSAVETLPGVGEARTKALARLNLHTAEDLLRYFPRDYEDRRKCCSIQEAPGQGAVCIWGMVAESPRCSRIRKGLELTKVKVVDDTSAMTVTFFNQSYIHQVLQPGERYLFFGRAEREGSWVQMSNPVFEREDRVQFLGRLMPIYPLTAGISNRLLAGLIRRCIDPCAGQIPELLPSEIRGEYQLAQSEFSYRNIHFPADENALALARRRLIFEELFYLSCGLTLLRSRRTGAEGPVCAALSLAPFYDLLPFSLTDAQRRTMEEAAADLAQVRPMNRLVQGDVGSGKTVVAAACAWIAHQSGWQSALMAPTELLAAQHVRSLAPLLAPAGMKVGLLTGSMTAKEKRTVRAALAAGEIHLLIGTHALLSQGVDFARLGLVITDEQHRFGVDQRAALSAKGIHGVPNVLVMSATPIPRTLALIIYGDLDVSVIDTLPPGRTPIETYVIGEDKRQRMYQFVRRQVRAGRQVYLVCPAVEEHTGQQQDLKAVTAYTQELQTQVFPDLRVALVHGKLRPKEKDFVMSAFAAGEIDILVSTTVIEVGVDVPNAALMVVENAERFGLSQLHQLRGRVGRGPYQSYCILMSNARNQESIARLKVLKETTDGFRIAEEDLKLRGPGDFFGQRQHGLPQLQIADLAGDTRILKQAQEAAQQLLAQDPDLSQPAHQPLLDRVRRLFAENPDIFN
ncbi:MAG: ATP-dependent DNA helicase RecG [Oscillospiraceae bacterium]|nr:ATP-dependent DNA helicase RecG [Oscillospiraceae bacterium]